MNKSNTNLSSYNNRYLLHVKSGYQCDQDLNKIYPISEVLWHHFRGNGTLSQHWLNRRTRIILTHSVLLVRDMVLKISKLYEIHEALSL